MHIDQQLIDLATGIQIYIVSAVFGGGRAGVSRHAMSSQSRSPYPPLPYRSGIIWRPRALGGSGPLAAGQGLASACGALTGRHLRVTGVAAGQVRPVALQRACRPDSDGCGWLRQRSLLAHR